METIEKYTLNFNGEVYEFNKDLSDSDKYILFAMAKNEEPYIIEWINHYKHLGFDKIILCDNNDIGNNSLIETISDFIQDGFVEIFDCRGLLKPQIPLYSMFMQEGNYQWCAFFDVDEFLEIPSFYSIKDFLLPIKEDCVLVNWLMFSSDGKLRKEDGDVQDRFKNPMYPIATNLNNLICKSIVKGHNVNLKGVSMHHRPFTKIITYNHGGYCSYHTNLGDKSTNGLRYRLCYLKHYYTKSFDEWCEKSNRGWQSGSSAEWTKNYFICNQKYNFSPQETIGVSGDWVNEVMKGKMEEIYDYSVVEFRIMENYYIYCQCIMYAMNYYKGKTFVVNCPNIDDSIYNMLLEYAYKSGNRLAFSTTPETSQIIANKYSDGMYYFITIG